MGRARVLLAGAVLTAVTLRLGAASQSTASSSSLAGVVIDNAKTPVACARVVLRGAGPVLSTRTGPDGRFTFNKIPFRSRWIGVEPDVSTTVNDRSFPDALKMTLQTSHSTLLAGVLLDEHHQPVKNIEVTAFARKEQYGRTRFVPVANDVTEGDGSYCIRVPGIGQEHAVSEFIIGVIPTGTWLKHPIGAPNIASLAGHPPTYFPSVTTSAAATALAVGDGEARRDLNFSLQTGRVTQIEGRVLGPDVRILGASNIVLEPPDEDVTIHRLARADASGHFVFNDVTAGDYTVRVFPPSLAEGAGRWGTARVTARGETTVRVTVPTQPTQTFAGLISFAGAPAMLPGVRVFFTVNAERVAHETERFPASFYPSAFSFSDGHGGFAVRNLMPGPYRLSVSGADWRGWHLDAITESIVDEDGTVSTRDVTKTPLIVEAGRDTFGAKVELSVEVPQITGVVDDDAGTPIGSRVIVFPVDETTWRSWTGSLVDHAETQTRLDGTFACEAIPPGDYLVVALRDGPAFINTAMLAALRPLATRLTVGPYPAAVRVALTQVAWPPRNATVDLPVRSKR